MSALESSHAIWESVKIARSMQQDQDLVVVCHFSFAVLQADLIINLDSVCLDEVIKMSSRSLNFFPNGQIF